MNEAGYPATLRASQPANRNAMKSGVYSRRVRAERVEEIRTAATGISTLALVQAAVRDEVARLHRVRQGLDDEIATRGPSTRAGAARGQVSQRSSVSRQLAKLEVTWAMGESVDDESVVDRGSDDNPASTLREELLASLALRDLLDHDLEHRGVSTPRGGERRQVLQRVQASRDLVRLADRIRAEARRARRSGSAPMSAWDIAREIALDPSQGPSRVIAAVQHLLTRPAPRATCPKQARWEEKVRGMSDPEIDALLLRIDAANKMSEPELAALLLELDADDNELRTTPRPDSDMAADTENEPEPSEAPGTDTITRCLEILQRIGDGFDSRATGPDRMRAAALREQHLAATSPRDPLRDLIESWTPEELEEETESLLAEND